MTRQRQPRSGQGRVRDLEQFLRDYTDGLKAEDLRRLFRRDASRAYAVLARDQKGKEPPRGRLKLFFHRARIVFLGLSYKLTPARRFLFAMAMLFALMGMMSGDLVYDNSGFRFELATSGFWYLASIASLVYLLAMELVDRVLVRDELEVARALQRDLLPGTLPPLPGYRIAHSYRTANEVGGDYYDFLPLPEGRVALLVADASGHGIASGLLMAIASSAVKTALDLDPSPVAVASLVNRALLRSGSRRSFLSLFYALLEPETGELDYLSAGHPFPLLRRASGAIVELGRGSLPLGVRADLSLAQEHATLAPGDLLLLLSDGLVEAVGSDGAAFGYERVRALLAPGGSPEEIHARVLAAFDQHVAGEALADDLTLVVLERRA